MTLVSESLSATAVAPTTVLESAFLAMLDDFDARGPHNTEFYAPARVDFAAYVQGLKDEEAGVNLPDGFVPCTHRWLVTGAGAVAGVTRLRHSIGTPFLAQSGGHVGYDVAPSYRGRSLGHLALATALAEARRIGLGAVLLYTGEDNAPSRATIERAGGVLEGIAYSEFWQEPLCKYWITVPAPDLGP